MGFNTQEQIQFDGGIGFDQPGEVGQAGLGGAVQLQSDFAVGVADPGDAAFDAQAQNQVATDGFTVVGGADSFSTNWTAEQDMWGQGTTSNGGVAEGGFYTYEAQQGQGGVAFGANDENGTGSIAGSAYVGGNETNAFVVDGQAVVTAEQSYSQSYVNDNDGQDNYIIQTGHQDVQMGSQAVASSPTGFDADSSSAYVVQGGGTAATNDDSGNYQAGVGFAAGEAGGTGTHYAEGLQIHSYENVNNEPAQGEFQTQTGTVGTYVSSN